MVKFYKIKDTEIRKAVENINGIQKPVALIGTVQELAEKHIITCINIDEFNGPRWMVVPAGADDQEQFAITYETLAEAKASIPAARIAE